MAGVRQFDEDKTLARAMDIFWQKGLGATSMQDLAQATGVLRGSLYNAYQSKEQLFLKVFERYKKAMLGEIGAALDKPVIDDALKAFFEFTIHSMTLGSPTRGCLTTKTALDSQAEIETLRLALQGMLDGMQALIRTRLEAQDAVARLTLSPAQAARLIVTFTRGVVVMERVYQNPEQLREIAASVISVVLAR